MKDEKEPIITKKKKPVRSKKKRKRSEGKNLSIEANVQKFS